MTDPTETEDDNRECLIEFIKEGVRKSHWNGFKAGKELAVRKKPASGPVPGPKE